MVGEEGAANFEGIGEGHTSTIALVIKGEIQFKNFAGGEIVVEARESFPCAYERCPVIEKEPLGVQRLSQPGPYSLTLTRSEKNLMIVASYFSPHGGVRIAHLLLEDPKLFNDSVNLSLNRPYSPLR